MGRKKPAQEQNSQHTLRSDSNLYSLLRAMDAATEGGGEEVSRMNVEMQKETIEEFADNMYLQSAMEGRLSIREAYNDLDEKLRGIKRILPVKKDKHHNAAVEILGELLPTEHLKTRGMLALDNYAMGTAVSVGLGYLATYTANFAFGGEYIIGNGPPLITGLIISPWTGFFFGQMQRQVRGVNVKYGMSARACADYLDEKLEKLGFTNNPEVKERLRRKSLGPLEIIS